MTATGRSAPSPDGLVNSLTEFIQKAVDANRGSTQANKPGHRIKFHWPPHPVSYDYHVTPGEWKDKGTFQAYAETFDVEIATTKHGVFGRCQALWIEARGEDRPEMLTAIAKACEPLFDRQFAISKTLSQSGRFKRHIRDLPPEDVLKLLYCSDRDVAHQASVEIETHVSLKIFTPALIEILKDRKHPNRRVAQWCVLDLFEDLPGFCADEKQENEAVEAMAGILWDAEDDFARTTFKAGVVLGGHLPHKSGGPVLLRSLKAPSPFGRRSAIHGLFHVVEWQQEMRDEVVAALRAHSKIEDNDQLKEFAVLLASDIELAEYDHIPEPVFPGES